MVFHDKSLKRVCGMDKDLYTQTYAQLQEYPLPDGSKIPLFSEVLALVDGKTPMIVEIKYHDRIAQTCEAAYEQSAPLQGRILRGKFSSSGSAVVPSARAGGGAGRAGFRRQVEAGRIESL